MNPITEALCELLSRFADPTHPMLKESPFKGHVHKGTGVGVFQRDDTPSTVLFSFFATINKGEQHEDSKLVRVKFDFQQLETHGKDYIQGTVQQAQKGIKLFEEYSREQHKDDKVLTLH